ncbi:MAG: hypothetical protein DDT28_00657 [Dehalococcoidia bacterium]|nr:hypothetical protein [Chloroflexota bacterium]MBT9160963.1 hypothetical protein [Chloroflexota bacterium]
MDPRFLDVLHYPSDHEILPIEDGIHLNLGGLFQELVYQDRLSRRYFYCCPHVPHQSFLVVNYLHSPPTQHIGRPDQNRVTNPCCYLQRLLKGESGPILSLRNAQS